MSDGRPFKLWRKQSGLTQMQAAKHFNVSRQTITQWEAGIGNIPADLPNLVDVVPGAYKADNGRRLSGSELRAKREMELKAGIWELAMQAQFVEGIGMVLAEPCPERGWIHVPPWGALHWAFDIRRNVKGEDHVPDFVKENVRAVREAQARAPADSPAPQANIEGVDTSAWHRQDGSPIDKAPADEIVRNTAGGQLPAAIARELLASHAQGRAPDYAQAQRDIEAAQAARLKPAPIPYEAWRAASGVLNLPSRRG